MLLEVLVRFVDKAMSKMGKSRYAEQETVLVNTYDCMVINNCAHGKGT